MEVNVLIRRPAARLEREYGFTLLCTALQEGACSLSTGGECLRFGPVATRLRHWILLVRNLPNIMVLFAR